MAKTKRKLAKKKATTKAKKAVKALARKPAAKKKSAPKKKPVRKVKMQNPFIWHDLMTPDVAGAKAFYSAVVGWNFTPQPPAYNVANVGNVGMGGIMETPEHLKGMPPFWSGYIHTPNVDKACAAIKKAGGHVHREPWDIPGMLRMAVVADSDGAVFNIMQPFPREGGKMLAPGTSGTVGWNELYAGGVKSAEKFYAKLFNWKKSMTMPMGPGIGDYILMDIGKTPHVGVMQKMAQMPRPAWNFYFMVDGIEAAMARIKERGGKITNGPMQVPGGQWAVNAIDPQGAHFGLLSKAK